MKTIAVYPLIGLLSVFNIVFAGVPADRRTDSLEWKAGVAQVVITPEEPMWMAGYAFRNRPSEGKLHDLRAKALALEDADGKQVLLITSDIIGFTKASSDRIRDRLADRFGLPRARIMLNSSHTHTGPEVDALKYSWRADDTDSGQLEKVEQYVKNLEDQVVQLAGNALQSLQPATLYAGNGVARFQVNRRNNKESTLNQQDILNGPNDYAVPVIKVVNKEGKLLAIAFGYACHPTVLSGYKLSGDYAGYAQLELENRYPGATAMFFQGAAGDQNPMPRGRESLAVQYGKDLAASVEQVLGEDMHALPSRLSAAYAEVALPFSEIPSKEELMRFSEEASGYQKRWAVYLLDKLRRGEPLMSSYQYPIQVWKLGEQAIISLGGEPVVDYAITLKRIFGQDIFVLGYSNDPNMAYIPTARILREGGYEGASSQMAKGLPGSWSPAVETIIIHEVLQLAAQAEVRVEAASLFGE